MVIIFFISPTLPCVFLFKIEIILLSSKESKEFQKDNFFKAYRLYQITDKVDSVFKLDNTIFNQARFSVINLIEKSKKLKNQISDFAMGVN